MNILKSVFTFAVLILVNNFSFAQCTPSVTGQHVWNNPFHEPVHPTTNFGGYMCNLHDTLIADTTGGNGGWQFFFGDGYAVRLIAGSQIHVATYASNVAIPFGLTINDSTLQTIVGAHSAAALNDSINFTAPYTGLFYVVFDSNNICNIDGQFAVASVIINLKNAATVNCFLAPINDTICGAKTLILNTPITDDNTNAVPTDPRDNDVVASGFGCSSPNNTLWYSFTPAMSGNYLIETSSPANYGLDAWVGLLSATSCISPFIKDSCMQGCTNGQGINKNFVTLSAGNTYYIMIDGQSGSVGKFTVEIINAPPAPVNDTICGAKTLVLNTPITDDNTNAAPTDPRDNDVIASGYGCSTPNNTLWYEFTSLASANYFIQTNSPAINGLHGWVGVFNATSCSTGLNNGSCLPACAPGNGTINDTVFMTAGTHYYIMVDGFLGAVGSYTIEITKDTTSSIGINTIKAFSAISFSPNPATDWLTIKGKWLNENIKIEVFDLLGKQQQSITLNDNETIQKIDISALPNGIDFIKTTGTNGKMLCVNKLIKQ